MDKNTSSVTDRPWLVALDLSSCGDAAADLALTDVLPMRQPPRVVLFHAYSPPAPPVAPFGVMLSMPAGAEEAVRASVRRALESVADRLRGRWLEETGGETPIHIDVALGCDAAANAILAEAERIDAARIFVGTHGRKGIRRILLGSVAERVLRLADVPVVVVHAPADAERLAA
jgi:nucleotide-binding universal stress UspA family protein